MDAGETSGVVYESPLPTAADPALDAPPFLTSERRAGPGPGIVVGVSKPVESTLLGRMAPGLTLPTLQGTAFDLEDLRGTPVLVSFLRHAG